MTLRYSRSGASVRWRLVVAVLATISVLFALPTDRHAAAASPTAVAPVASLCPAFTSGVLKDAPSVSGALKTVALTFDDGPGPSTKAIIGILHSFHVRATFFNIGLRTAADPAMVHQELANGYLIGNHTWNHPPMAGLSATKQSTQISQTIAQQWLQTATAPCVFRAPDGSYDQTTVNLARASSEAFWTYNDVSDDTRPNGSAAAKWVSFIENNVVRQAKGKNHVVVLMHNQKIRMPATVAALPFVITYFLDRGYVFVDLMGRHGPPGVCGDPVVATPSPAATTVPNGATLAAGSSVESPSGQYRLVMGADGNLTLSITGGRSLWSSGTSGHAGASAIVNSDGTLSVVANGGPTLWHSSGSALTGASLKLNNDGNLLLTNGVATSWSTNTRVTSLVSGDRLFDGWYVSSPNGRCRLTQATSGSLQLVAADGQVLWASNSQSGVGVSSTLQSDGNFVSYSADKTVVWASSTSANPGDHLSVANNGTINFATSTGTVLWSTQ